MKLYLSKNRENTHSVIFRRAVDVLSADDLKAAVSVDHMSSKMDHAYRNSSNFIETDCIMVDFDNDHSNDPNEWLTLDDITDALPDVHLYAVRSRNYMKPKRKVNKDGSTTYLEPREKYHVYCPLSATITSADDYGATMADISAIFPFFDDNAKDTARMFFGVQDPYIEEVKGSKNIDDYLNEASTMELVKAAKSHKHNTADDVNAQAVADDVLPEIKTALERIPVSLCSYTDWIRAGISLKNIGAPFEWFDEWSRNDQRYDGTEATLKKWKSFDKSESQWNAGTIFNLRKRFADKTQAAAPEKNVSANTSAKKIPALTFVNAAQLATAILPEIYYAVKDLISEGTNIIAAPPKSGKSWLVLLLALAVAAGKKFLGFETNKSDVVYFALEDGDKFEQERLLKLCDADKVPRNFHYVFEGVVPLDEGFIDQLDQAYNSFPNLKLVIIDTLKFVASKQKKNETAYERDYRTGRMLKTWADQHGVALVIVTHTTKLVHPDDALANVTGTNGVTGAADVVMVIAKEKRTATDAVLAVDGRRVRQSEHEIKIDWNTCKWKYVGLADPDERDRRRREREINELRNSSAYKAIMLLADKNVKGWKGKARKLIDDASEYGVFVTESPKEVGGMLTNHIAQLAQDGVRVEIIKNGTSGNIYRLSMWEKRETFE